MLGLRPGDRAFGHGGFAGSTRWPGFPPGRQCRFRGQEEAAAAPVYDVQKYPESSATIMCHKEVLDYFQKGRTTIIHWRKERGFPEPISKSPLRWIRS